MRLSTAAKSFSSNANDGFFFGNVGQLGIVVMIVRRERSLPVSYSKYPKFPGGNSSTSSHTGDAFTSELTMTSNRPASLILLAINSGRMPIGSRAKTDDLDPQQQKQRHHLVACRARRCPALCAEARALRSRTPF